VHGVAVLGSASFVGIILGQLQCVSVSEGKTVGSKGGYRNIACRYNTAICAFAPLTAHTL